jgi:predicted dehydrogenase
MARKKLNIGMIGYGFMGRAHSNAYRKVNNFFDLEYTPVLKAVCARNEGVKAFADTWGYESTETDWRKLIERDDIDAIDICTPNNLHNDIAIAAAEAGKMILCEKPLSMDGRRGRKNVQGRRESRRAQHRLVQLPPRARRHPRQTTHRRRPPRPHLPLPRRLPPGLDHRHRLPQGGEGLWRLDAAAAGSGVTGDLLAHCIDTAIWLNGSIGASPP